MKDLNDTSERIKALMAPSDIESQLTSLFETALATSQELGQISSEEVAICAWIVRLIIPAVREPYKAGLVAGIRVGRDKERREDRFRKEFREMMGFEWTSEEKGEN